MTKLTQSIIKKIKKENIKPTPKWYFVLMHALLWVSVLISILLGAMATAIILRHALTHEWELIHRLKGGKTRMFIMMLPYFWFAFIGLIIFVSSKLFSRTKKGYRIRPWIVVTSSVLLSLIAGIIFYTTHLDQPFENRLRRHLPFYQQREHRVLESLVAPDEGLLAGRITQIVPKKQILLLDFKKTPWVINIDTVRHGPLQIDMKVGIVGEKVKEGEFRALEIKPLKRFEDRRAR